MVRSWLLWGITVVLGAQEGVLVSGTSTLKKGRVIQSQLGSMIAATTAPAATEGAQAILVDPLGRVATYPCNVERHGDEEGSEVLIWRFRTPGQPEGARLEIRLDGKVAATLEPARKCDPPQVEFLEAPREDGITLAWILKRDRAQGMASYWVRWSADGGRTWLPGAQLFPGNETGSQIDLLGPAAAKGTLVELWVPEGLRLHRFQHTLGQS